MRKPILIGECPNSSEDSRPLFGRSTRTLVLAAGWAKCWTDRQFYEVLTRHVVPVNLCEKSWKRLEARETRDRLFETYLDGRPYILLGRRVAKIFKHEAPWFVFLPREFDNSLIVSIPHPSGLNRYWNDPKTAICAGEVLRTACLISLHGWS